MDKRKLFKRIVLILDIFLLIISVISYRYIYAVETGKLIYSEQTEKFVEENKTPVFSIEKIVLYSSADWVDNSEGKLQNLDISQFTDISVFINNKGRSEEISAENTISKLYIDNIKIEGDNRRGEKIFNYKNPLDSGKYVDLRNYSEDKIEFLVPLTNDENKEANYDESVFYTDCSNPISLGYVNKNILTNVAIDGTNASIEKNATVLKMAGVDINELKSAFSFSIHLVNNYNEEFFCNVKIDNDLSNNTENSEGIFDGYIMKIIDTTDEKYNFLKIK